ncbi:MAG: TolC family protein [Candidatus Solibacter usitatus]|nr:TolC family protein [Candidatus Solibacter usitatus]
MKFLVAILVTAATAHAQDKIPLPLSLRKSIEIALAPEGNTRIEIAQEIIHQAEARRSLARAALLPNLDGVVSYADMTRNLNAFGFTFPSFPGFRFSSFAGPFGILDARANVTQSVLDFGNVRRYQSARTAVGVARQEQSHVRTQVTDQVARAYLGALRSAAQVDAAKANVALAESIRALALSQKNAGSGTGIEVTRAEVQLSNEHGRLSIARNEYNKAQLQLLRAMDLRLDTAVELTDKLSYTPLEPIAIEQAVMAALAARSDLKAQQERERVAQISYQANALDRLPSIAAFGDYGSIGREFAESRATRSVGLSLRVPIFDGGRRDARRAESASQLRQERIRTRDLREQMEFELRIAFDSLRSSDLQVATAEQGLALAQKEYDQAERRYKAGVAPHIEVTDAQTRLARARDTRVIALFAHNLARLDLGTAMGSVERYLP